jgi:hypothetical protein
MRWGVLPLAASEETDAVRLKRTALFVATLVMDAPASGERPTGAICNTSSSHDVARRPRLPRRVR